MLQIHIGSITEQGLGLDEKIDASLLPLLHSVSNKERIRFVQPVHVHLQVTLAGETILIDGSAVTVVRLACSRCLEPFDLPIETRFSATATPQMSSMTDTEPPEEMELAADQMDVIAYSGDSIDLGDEIAQQIIMALPFKPVCRDTCKGLCNRCGADLNRSPCRCASRDINNPFAVLKTLSFPKNKE